MSLPRVPLDSNNERQHRTVIATTVNELVKVRPPFDRTEAEVAAGVTPLDYGYAPGDDRRYFAFSDFCKVVSQGEEGHIWTDHSISIAHDITGDATIIVHGRRTITATAVMDYMLRHSGELTIDASGELLFDGDVKVTYACLHSTSKLPNLRNVCFLDSNFGLNTGPSVSTHTYGVTGDGIWENVIAENCADVGWNVRGTDDRSITGATSANPIVFTTSSAHGYATGDTAKFAYLPGDFGTNLNETTKAITVLSSTTFSVAVDGSAYAAYTSGGRCNNSTATLTLKHCGTRGTTGSDNFDSQGVGFLYFVGGLKHYERWGGLFKGDADAESTDGYRCHHVEIHGGWHDKVGRGPTVGNSSQLVVVEGTATSESAGNAVSIDTTLGSGETTTVGIAANNIGSRTARTVRTTGSHIIVANNYSYENTNANGPIVAAGQATHVFFNGNYVYSTVASGVYFAYTATETTNVKIGINGTNSTHRSNFSAASASSNLMDFLAQAGAVRSVSSNTDLRGTDRVLVVDASAGAVDIDLFDETEVDATGFSFAVLKTDTSNQVSITFQGGAANGETVNGGTSVTIPASYANRPVHLVCENGATGTWRAYPPPPTAYMVTNATTDRSYDADAALVTETNDVLATLLADLGMR